MPGRAAAAARLAVCLPRLGHNTCTCTVPPSRSTDYVEAHDHAVWAILQALLGERGAAWPEARRRAMGALASCAPHAQRLPPTGRPGPVMLQRRPDAESRTTSRCQPSQRSSGYRASLRSQARGCGRPPRLSGAASAALQRSALPKPRDGAGRQAQRCGTALRSSAMLNKIQAAPVPRTDVAQRCWRITAEGRPCPQAQAFTRNADPRLFEQGGAARQQSAAQRTLGTPRLRKAGASGAARTNRLAHCQPL